jgi:hypothetical protein
MSDTEPVATYTDGRHKYEVEHLGASFPDTLWGKFLVWCDGESVTAFEIPEAEIRPPRPFPASAELIRLARWMVANEDEGAELRRIPAELRGRVRAAAFADQRAVKDEIAHLLEDGLGWSEMKRNPSIRQIVLPGQSGPESENATRGDQQ